jgi:HlyD family secretion protein
MAPLMIGPAGAGSGRRRASLMGELRGQIAGGVLVVGLLLGGSFWWAASTPLASAAIAPGLVSPEGSRRTVQHLEGGIIRTILVREGSVVRVGEPLIVLEDLQARASFDVLQTRFYTLAAVQARLLAEQVGAERLAFPDWLVQAAESDATALQAMVAQRQLFETRARARADRAAIVGRRIAQLGEEIAGLEAQILSDDRRIALLEEEIGGVEQLYRKGLERKARLLALRRAQAEIDGARAERRAGIARAHQAIGEAELQIIAQGTASLDAVNEELARTQAELAEIEQRLAVSQDALARTLITAPINGTVVELRFRAQGGVVRPGEPLLDIVPENEELLIDARVSPMDIDVVRPGLPAQIVLPALKQRQMPRIGGRVVQVSADALSDPQSGQRFFRAQIEIDPAPLATLPPDIELTPGMPAEVYVTTGTRTVLDYLLAPLYDSLRRALRES